MPHGVAIVRTAVAGMSLGAALLLGAPATACPNCAVGQQARSEVWNDDFGKNLLVALLPFLVIGALCVRAERIGRAPSLAPSSEPLTLRRAKS